MLGPCLLGGVLQPCWEACYSHAGRRATAMLGPCLLGGVLQPCWEACYSHAASTASSSLMVHALTDPHTY